MNNQTIKTGDTIKSFDFPSRDDCYMTGQVVSIEGGLITCKTLSIVSRGAEREINEQNNEFRTPELGLDIFDDMNDRPRIQIIN